MQTLHRPDAVFSLRHAPSWLMLTFAAGAVNGTTLLACQRFVTHVTGTVTRLGVEMAHATIMLDFALVLFCFIAGAMLAGLLIEGRARRGRRPLFALPLWMTAGATALIAVLGDLGCLGSFGGTVDQPVDFLLLSVLSFAMGLQNAAVATSTGLLVRTTHLTGPATDLGMHLAEMLFADPATREVARRHAALRAGKIVSFALGAAAAVPLAHRFGFLAFLLPALVTAAATLLSFVAVGAGDGAASQGAEAGTRSAA
jgi:uncharacterized membrane protein YoaK (UPF0700 family)